MACRDAVVGVVGSISDKEVQTLLAAFQKVKVRRLVFYLSEGCLLSLHAEGIQEQKEQTCTRQKTMFQKNYH